MLVTWAFLPGLGGQLVFDDIPNLLPWQTLGDINSAADIATFVFSGTGGLGRPLSLLSFLIDDQNWQPDIFSLKRTNLAIHLINTCLIFWLCLKISSKLVPGLPAQQGLVALLATAIWGLHPLQVSTVSYVIQRMNLLSTLFELAGLIIFIYGREHLVLRPRKAILLCTLGIGLFMPLAVLAKENGLLLCAFAILIESYCFEERDDFLWRRWKMVFLWTPIVLFIIYCLITYRFFTIDYPNRNFNSWERLITQGHVITDYLRQLVLPRLHGTGLYFDNYAVTRTLANPATLLKWLLILSLIFSAILLRTRNKLFSFGIFFYICGHLMESTLLPLELYFEHRNYLPQIGIWLAIASFLQYTHRVKINLAITTLAISLIVMLLFMTRSNASLWADTARQTAVWYHENPGSFRAITNYSQTLLEHGNPEAALNVLQTGQKHHPNNLNLEVSRLFLECYWLDREINIKDLPALAKRADHEFASISMLEKLRPFTNTPAYKKSRCKPLSTSVIAQVYLNILENPRYSTKDATYSSLHQYLAEINSDMRNMTAAMYHYERAFQSSRNPIYPYRQALLLQSAGQPDMAIQYAGIAKSALTPRKKLLYPELENRIASFLEQLHQTSSAKRPHNDG